MAAVYNDDSVLISRFQRGDKSAFDALVQKHQARAYQFAFRLTRDQETAADVVAETFVRIFRSLGSFKGNSAFSTWLYRIITNCFLDMRKKAANRPTTSLDAGLLTDDGEVERQFEDEHADPFVDAVRSERESRVHTALEAMPEYQRAIILMYHVEMLSYEEIAEALDLPIGTVKSRLNRARLALRDQLMPEKELFLAA